MFAQDSRYVKLAQYTVTMPNGQTVTATRVAVPPQAGLALAGFHPRVTGDRLDLLAARYLSDPTLFWKLCDANNTPAPAALAARPLIGIPLGGQ
jgi:hypothetical protein